MAGIPLQKRPHDLFVSYAHANQGLVDPIVHWLKDKAGLNLWYDVKSGDASKRTTTLLTEGILSSRGLIVFLSSAWVDSSWTRDEFEVALTERRENDDFLVLTVRIDDCELQPWFKIANVLDFSEFQASSCAALLRSLAPNPPTRLNAEQDVYLSAPWSRPTDATKKAVRSIGAMGWRLVGDSPDHPDFVDEEERIASIIGTSRGMITVLPYLPSKPPRFTSEFILREATIALRSKQLYLLLAEPEVQIPEELLAGSFGQRATLLTSETKDSVQQVLSEFDEEISHKPFTDTRTYSFLATSFFDNREETEDLVTVIEHASNINCMQGQGFSSQNVQKDIIDRIRRAAFVLADVTDDHRNTLIEAGVAMGAGTPLHLMCKVPENGSRHRRFMFEAIEMNWYETPIERLGIAYKIGSKYRRRLYCPR